MVPNRAKHHNFQCILENPYQWLKWMLTYPWGIIPIFEDLLTLPMLLRLVLFWFFPTACPMLLVPPQVKNTKLQSVLTFPLTFPNAWAKWKGNLKVLTNTPKGDSGKCNCMVRIFTAKFALMEVSKFYVKNQTQEHGMIIILKQESDTFDKKNDLKIIIYT